ncbi:MAG: sulfatase-like hydrolase/transferase [Muribaculaceae bacterium]|jgi:phosphoglycerol transferase MdoB-like AlkP superfamily enzyme|nr:sulfatase-like hydrolase/transferase [Muribaculaceae bacterium]
MLLVYLAFMLCRIIFLWKNWSTFAAGMTWTEAAGILNGGLVFDTSALLYINSLYLLLMLVPVHFKETGTWHKSLKWIYMVTNGIGIASNLIDCVYFKFTGRRTTITVFSEFGNENNIAGIILHETLVHWYLLLAFAIIIYGLWKLYKKPTVLPKINLKSYYIIQSVALILMVPITIIGIRGSAASGTRPITISNANQYVSRAIETAAVLNTPFSIIRTMGKKIFITPDYMSDKEMAATYSPIINPVPGAHFKAKNVVILIMESFGKEYFGFYNYDLEGGKYKGYTPFLDSLASQSLTFKYSFANGRKSMDATPSVLSSIPMFVEPFFLTPASLNQLSGISRELGTKGYYSAFFHGGHNISMGFQAFSHSIGYKEYFGLDEFCSDKHYNGMKEFDGKWAIFDEPFEQFMADKIHGFHQPFLVTLFSASSHEPFNLPDKYKNIFPEQGLPMHKCVRYADMSLRHFFDRAKREPWYNNTVFVIVADHTSISDHAEYQTDMGLFKVPIIIYTPDGSVKPAYRDDVIAQQIDIMPTVLHLLGYDKPFVGFGCDLLNTPPQNTFAINYNNGIYQYFKGNYMLQFDGERTKAVYAFKTDPMLKHNLLGKVPQQAQMEKEVKAIIQQYMQRMNQNRLVIGK